MRIRSILWVGKGEDFPAELVAETPSLDVVWERDVEGALALSWDGFDAVLLDAVHAEAALRDVRTVRLHSQRPPLLVRVDEEEAGRTPELLSAGATDVALRPPGAGASAREALLAQIRGLASAPRPPGKSRRPSVSESFVGEARGMREVFALVECAARSRVTVLVSGETGTGKELVARAVHTGSEHQRRPFVAVNCAAFPDTLLESELFGHAKGAFTGATRDKRGLFEIAERGTLFLDEVAETSRPFQAKLLRVLQEREVRPLGGTAARRVNARVVAATNRDLWRESLEGRFREDLYYRLAVFPIHVPPLRERPGDILLLAEHFLALHGDERAAPRIAPESAQLLAGHRWPGNVRELENEVQRALALAHGEPLLRPEHFSERLTRALDPATTQTRSGETLRETLGRIEALLIQRALDGNDGHRTKTARLLGVTREGLYKKMKRLNVE